MSTSETRIQSALKTGSCAIPRKVVSDVFLQRGAATDTMIAETIPTRPIALLRRPVSRLNSNAKKAENAYLWDSVVTFKGTVKTAQMSAIALPRKSAPKDRFPAKRGAGV
ncbi:hypothetical protein MTO96_037390 [Rhipicephalus appendiculatus]